MLVRPWYRGWIPGRAVILYDTGDFVDDYAIDPALRNDLGALFLVRLHGRDVEHVELVPTTAGVG
jgi:poly-gamma-glutamate synthesis protein (capsule biosynthesis protein)